MNKLIRLKSFVLVVSFVAILLLFFVSPAESERMLNIQNYLITVSGIISAFMITYLASKIYNLRSERQIRQIEIDKLGIRLTAFRKILYYVIQSRDFWLHHGDIGRFKKDFPNVFYRHLHGNNEDDHEIRKKFYLEGYDISTSTITLYTSMLAIYGEDDERGQLPWATDRMRKIKYSIDELYEILNPLNQIWYLLDGRFGKHGVGNFSDNGINRLHLNSFNELLPQASIKHKGKDFHRVVLADIASDLYENVVPEMIELIDFNQGIPSDLDRTFKNLTLIMLSGVVIPLIVESIYLSKRINVFVTLFLVLVTLLALINFVLDFYKIIQQEVHLNEKG